MAVEPSHLLDPLIFVSEINFFDNAKDQLAAALENVKAQAIATADEIGRATRKTMDSAEGATEEDVERSWIKSKELTLQGCRLHARKAAKYLHRAVATVVLLSLILLFFRLRRRQHRATAPTP